MLTSRVLSWFPSACVKGPSGKRGSLYPNLTELPVKSQICVELIMRRISRETAENSNRTTKKRIDNHVLREYYFLKKHL